MVWYGNPSPNHQRRIHYILKISWIKGADFCIPSGRLNCDGRFCCPNTSSNTLFIGCWSICVFCLAQWNTQKTGLPVWQSGRQPWCPSTFSVQAAPVFLTLLSYFDPLILCENHSISQITSDDWYWLTLGGVGWRVVVMICLCDVHLGKRIFPLILPEVSYFSGFFKFIVTWFEGLRADNVTSVQLVEALWDKLWFVIWGFINKTWFD